jgi:hypothetical protein
MNFFENFINSVAEPHHYYEAPDLGNNFDAAPEAPAPTCNCKVSKR